MSLRESCPLRIIVDCVAKLVVVDKLTDGLVRTCHVAPADVKAALAEHGHPANLLETAEGIANGHSLEWLEKSAAKRSPHEDHTQPPREGDHDEGEEESGDEELVQCRPV